MACFGLVGGRASTLQLAQFRVFHVVKTKKSGVRRVKWLVLNPISHGSKFKKEKHETNQNSVLLTINQKQINFLRKKNKKQFRTRKSYRKKEKRTFFYRCFGMQK